MSDLLSAWTVTYLIHSTILILVAFVACRWIRSAQVRDLLWKVAMVGAIVTASFQIAVPSSVQVPLSGLSPSTSTPVPATLHERSVRPTELPPVHTADSARSRLDLTSVTEAAANRPEVAAMVRRGIQWLLGFAWLIGAAFFLGRLIFGHATLLRDLENRVPLIDGDDFEALERLRAGSGARSSVRLSASDKAHSPMAMLGSEIVIPRPIFARLTPTQRESILAHELAHVRRRDPEWLTLGQIISAVLFFQPLNRLALGRFKETAEYICDDVAVHQTGDRKALAETLAELAATISPRWWVRVAGMGEGGSPLIRRVSRVLRQGIPDEPARLRFGLKMAIVLVPLALIAAVGPGMASPPAADEASVNEARGDSVAGPADQPDGQVSSAGAVSTSPVAASSGPVVEESADEPETFYVTGRKVETTKAEFQRFQDGSLTQSFEGPEGSTTVRMTAHAVEVAIDGSWVRFFESDGFLRVRQQADRGPSRDVDVTAGPGGEPRYVYRVDGTEKEWCSDAERVIVASWRGKKAYEGWSPSADTTRPREVESSGSISSDGISNWSTHLKWTAHVENETDDDGVRRRLRLVAEGFHYNPDTGEIYLEPDGILEIDEVVGSRKRSFTLTAHTVNWGGDLEGRGSDLPKQWLRGILAGNSSLPASVIETITRR
ncbi:MAG: M56 family metallopeptidase [Acidobacteria bacterium]|nr:M56 family metallopeptidase [Acidobacteriota bacterium]